jgi:hypothetical protein
MGTFFWGPLYLTVPEINPPLETSSSMYLDFPAKTSIVDKFNARINVITQIENFIFILFLFPI